MAAKNGEMSDGAKAGIGIAAGVAAAGMAAAGYYFYASEGAEKNRKVAAKWARDMKKEVLAQADKAKKIDRKAIVDIVSNAAKTYAGAKNMDRAEVMRAAKELKSNWQQIAKELGRSDAVKGAKKAIGSAKKTAKKAASKSPAKKSK